MSDFSIFKTKEDSYGFLFWKTYSLWSRNIKKALNPLKLSHTQSVILNVIAYLETSETQISQKMISNVSNIDVMTLSTSIKSLIKSGYVLSTKNESDPRSNVITLTDKGSLIQKKAMTLIEEIDQAFFEGPEIDIAQFKQSLKTLIDGNSNEEA